MSNKINETFEKQTLYITNDEGLAQHFIRYIFQKINIRYSIIFISREDNEKNLYGWISLF